ncbi:MFS transporter [Nocardioides sambongensis]|uniref:MFS transporter n=1 Tax=Nocardioides sambongensis TaxID=2589074 RepID=UPI001E4CB067|nr:MFS transporter [Nocardioides sambongensis]
MTTPTTTAVDLTGQTKNLLLATWAFAISFWAWNMIAPLGVRYTEILDLSSTEKSVLVAVPVIVGSVGRIVTGALTDRYGGRVMFPILLVASAPFVVLVAVAGNMESFPLLLLFGFFLGIAGTTFAVGIPFANAWFTKDRRGFATGVFGAGMGGTALSAFFTPRMVDWWGYTTTHVLVAVALVATAGLVRVAMTDSPAWSPNNDPVVPKLAAAARLPVTWQMSFLYAVAFGGFVAFSTYLPTYLKDVYDFGLTEAGTRTSGFAIAAVVCRPIGGVLADKVGPRVVAAVAFAGAAVMAVVLTFQPPTEIPAGLSFVLMAGFLGIGTGAVFTWVAQLSPPERVGAVTGIVGAAGGLGGFFPPLVMGATYNEAEHSYTIGLLLLCLVAAGALVFTLLGIRSRPRRAAR